MGPSFSGILPPPPPPAGLEILSYIGLHPSKPSVPSTPEDQSKASSIPGSEEEPPKTWPTPLCLCSVSLSSSAPAPGQPFVQDAPCSPEDCQDSLMPSCTSAASLCLLGQAKHSAATQGTNQLCGREHSDSTHLWNPNPHSALDKGQRIGPSGGSIATPTCTHMFMSLMPNLLLKCFPTSQPNQTACGEKRRDSTRQPCCNKRGGGGGNVHNGQKAKKATEPNLSILNGSSHHFLQELHRLVVVKGLSAPNHVTQVLNRVQPIVLVLGSWVIYQANLFGMDKLRRQMIGMVQRQGANSRWQLLALWNTPHPRR